VAKIPALKRLTVALTWWSFGHLANDPPSHRLSIRLSAAGLREGLPAAARMEISGDDGYLITAAPVVACLRRLLEEGIRRPGVWLQGQVVDPDDFFTDLASFGLTVETEVSPQGSPAA
jgi:saccharopine dehydrogenase (NAD+, L-lysine-forming)